MKNYIEQGDVADYTASAAVASGDVVVIGDRVGIAATDIAKNETGSVDLVGVFEVSKVAATAIAQGKKVYWDATNKVMTSAATGNTFAGYAHVAAASADTTVKVNLAA